MTSWCMNMSQAISIRKCAESRKTASLYYRKVIENVLPRHRMALGHILKNNDLQLDNQFFDASQKQVIFAGTVTQ